MCCPSCWAGVCQGHSAAKSLLSLGATRNHRPDDAEWWALFPGSSNGQACPQDEGGKEGTPP